MASLPAGWQDCIDFALAHETPWPRDPRSDLARWGVHNDDPPPWNRLRGPVHSRGGVSGVVWQRGVERLLGQHPRFHRVDPRIAPPARPPNVNQR